MADDAKPDDKAGAAGAAAAAAAVGGEAPKIPTANNAGKPTMAVKVYAPFKVYYEGEAVSVTAVNESGPFDILPKHHNFISLLNPCDLVVRSKKGDENIQIAGGIMHVKADQVIVFLEV